MKYRSSVETSYSILSLFIENAEFPQTDMPIAIDRPYRTVLRHLEPLQNSSLIELSQEVPSLHGKPARFFKITPRGILALLKFPPFHDPEIIEAIIQTNREHYPLIFQNWDFFKQNGIDRMVMARLLLAADQEKNPLAFMYFEKPLHDPQKHFSGLSKKAQIDKALDLFLPAIKPMKEVEALKKKLKENTKIFEAVVKALQGELENRMYERVFYSLPFNTPEDCLKFYSTIAKNEDLKNHTLLILDRNRARFESMDKSLREILK